MPAERPNLRAQRPATVRPFSSMQQLAQSDQLLGGRHLLAKNNHHPGFCCFNHHQATIHSTPLFALRDKHVSVCGGAALTRSHAMARIAAVTLFSSGSHSSRLVLPQSLRNWWDQQSPAVRSIAARCLPRSVRGCTGKPKRATQGAQVKLHDSQGNSARHGPRLHAPAR